MSRSSILSVLKRALARSWEHDVFGIAKGAAYSGVITLFPAMVVLAAILAASNQHELLEGLVTGALGRILPRGTSNAVMHYFTHDAVRPIGTLVTTTIATLWT